MQFFYAENLAGGRLRRPCITHVLKPEKVFSNTGLIYINIIIPKRVSGLSEPNLSKIYKNIFDTACMHHRGALLADPPAGDRMADHSVFNH